MFNLRCFAAGSTSFQVNPVPAGSVGPRVDVEQPGDVGEQKTLKDF